MPIDLEFFKRAYARWVEDSAADYRAGNMKEIVKRYPFVVSEDVPWTPYQGRPSDQTFALLTSGGIYLKDRQPPFDTASIHGDPSFREIPKTVRPQDIGMAHAHYDHSLAGQDLNVIFPIQRLIELERDQVIGKLADNHYSFSYVNDVVGLVTKSVPELIVRIKAAKIDVLFLIPV
ncbi:MAG: glycine/betaine/sarcosine/D-proline family reductase selenoprotein B [Desulfobacterales bacterium]|jgi:D-proline reductase (dithiol) PrdB|nr:glycine/betaine/sarcosine/D-proline family reductase selenoprotein B [Desulfobacterales bacterium]